MCIIPNENTCAKLKSTYVLGVSSPPRAHLVNLFLCYFFYFIYQYININLNDLAFICRWNVVWSALFSHYRWDQKRQCCPAVSLTTATYISTEKFCLTDDTKCWPALKSPYCTRWAILLAYLPLAAWTFRNRTNTRIRPNIVVIRRLGHFCTIICHFLTINSLLA